MAPPWGERIDPRLRATTLRCGHADIPFAARGELHAEKLTEPPEHHLHRTSRRRTRGGGLRGIRGAESVLEPTQIRVEYVARNEPGSDPAGDRLKFAVTDQRANLVFRATELRGYLASRQGCWPLHARSMAGASGRVSCSERCRRRPAREVPDPAPTHPRRAPDASARFSAGTASSTSAAPRRSRRDDGEVLVHETHDHCALSDRRGAALDRA